jgi:acid phosphatase (class A)
MRRALWYPALVCALLASGCALSVPRYLPYGQPDIRQLLPPPPAAGSAEDRRDLETVLEIQRSRTPEEVARAQADQLVSVFRFADVLGARFRAENLPKTALLFKTITREGNTAWDVAKTQWNRPRPFLASADVQPVIERPSSASYPSGHAACGWLWASVLGQMVPEKRSELYVRAREYSHNRVIGGVHYPSDDEAGELTGVAIAAVLMQSAIFRADLAEAKAELRAVLGY